MNINNDIATTVLACNNNVTSGDKACFFYVTLYQTKHNQKEESCAYHNICLALSKGIKKYQDLLNEKASLQNKVQRMIAQGASEDQIKLAEKTYREYNPKNILRLEREKFVNLMEGVGRYSILRSFDYRN